MNDVLLSQSPTVPIRDDRRPVDPALAAAARSLAAQGTILLHNTGILPFDDSQRIALFGRTQKDWIAVGYGSGGDVNAPYVTTLVDALRERGAVQIDEQLAARYESYTALHPADPGQEWGRWPRSFPEPELEDSEITAAAQRADAAVVVIGRAAGEDRDNVLEPGAYYLTTAEEALIGRVSRAFAHTVVVVNTGNVIDLSWIEDHPLDGVLLAWSGGMEGARAVADVLVGAAEPGGRLTDTIAWRYADYPSAGHFGDPEVTEYVEDVFVGYRYFETFAPQAVQYPFGYGLGYTSFDLVTTEVLEDRGTVAVQVTVTNTGVRNGGDVVQAYVRAPDGALSKPARVLVAFARTPVLAPGACAEITLSFPLTDLASYDDAGSSGHRSAWVLEPGDYDVFVGPDVRRADRVGAVRVPRLRVVRQLEEAAAVRPEHGFERMVLRRTDDGAATVAWEPVPTARVELRQRILDRLPTALERIEDPDATFAAVLDGTMALEDFVARLTPEELASLAYGDLIMDSPLGTPGNAGVLGGVSEALRARGIPPVTTTDGPSGLRLSAVAALLPCGTALASTWDPAAVRELGALHGEEMLQKGSDILLAPGMNIHRDPLCGRNFEYFAEDPLLTGAMASAIVAGVQSQGVAACPKHFAANNQETSRTVNDSRVSERALREIYLRGFEILVRDVSPHHLMTSYNRINGVWGHYHYDLVTTVLRGEWGYDGNVMTDWWMRPEPDPDFPAVRDSAYRLRAQVDVLMPGAAAHFGTTRDDAISDSFAEAEGITLGEMQRTALNVLRSLQRSGVDERRGGPER